MAVTATSWTDRKCSYVYNLTVLSPHSKKVLGSCLGQAFFCVEFASSPCVCVGSLGVLWLPLTVEKVANWGLS